MLGNESDTGVEFLCDFLCDNGFWFLDVFLSKEKLTVEVGEINGIEIDDMDFAEAGEDKVLEEFTTYAASADKQDFGLRRSLVRLYSAVGV